MTITITHIDQLYLLQEAVDSYLGQCDPKKHWRAVEAGEDIAEQLRQLAESARQTQS